MHSGSIEHILNILQRIKQALGDLNKEYDFANKYFTEISMEIDKLTVNIQKLDIFCKLNIESLEKLIDVLKKHIKKENNEVIKKDLTNLISDLEKELFEKLKNLH
jgi:hypothetical protein